MSYPIRMFFIYYCASGHKILGEMQILGEMADTHTGLLLSCVSSACVHLGTHTVPWLNRKPISLPTCLQPYSSVDGQTPCLCLDVFSIGSELSGRLSPAKSPSRCALHLKQPELWPAAAKNSPKCHGNCSPNA